MSQKTPYTVVEVVEERHPNQPENTPCIKPQHVLINGQKVRVAKDGIRIDHGDADRVAVVEVTLLVDEFSIRQVPNGYTDGKTSTSTGDHLHFEGPVNPLSEKELAERVAARFPFWGVDMEDGKGTPVTTKIEQPRDHLGRFTKRKYN